MTKPAIDERALEAAHEAFITSSCSNISLKDNICTVITAYLAAPPADKPDAAREQEDFETLASSQSLNTSYGDYAAGQYDAPRTQLCWMFYQQGRSDARMATATPPPSIPPKTEADYFGGLVLRARAAAAKASAKFPQPNYVTLKIAEEAGEVVRGAVHYAEGRMPWDEVEGEIVQLLAMLIRFVTEGDQINGVTPPASLASPEGE